MARCARQALGLRFEEGAHGVPGGAWARHEQPGRRQGELLRSAPARRMMVREITARWIPDDKKRRLPETGRAGSGGRRGRTGPPDEPRRPPPVGRADPDAGGRSSRVCREDTDTGRPGWFLGGLRAKERRETARRPWSETTIFLAQVADLQHLSGSWPGWRNWQTHGTQNPATFKVVSVRPRLRAPFFFRRRRKLPRRGPQGRHHSRIDGHSQSHWLPL